MMFISSSFRFDCQAERCHYCRLPCVYGSTLVAGLFSGLKDIFFDRSSIENEKGGCFGLAVMVERRFQFTHKLMHAVCQNNWYERRAQ